MTRGGGGRPDRDVTVGFQNKAEKNASKLSKIAKNTLKTGKNRQSCIICGKRSFQTVFTTIKTVKFPFPERLNIVLFVAKKKAQKSGKIIVAVIKKE